MKRGIVPIVVAAFALSAGVASALAPSYNSGYDGWWPGGDGYPPVTGHAHDYPCSVTAYGPTFKSNSGGWRQNYGGGTSCTRGIGVKTLTISDQVLGQNGHQWFTVSGSGVTAGPIKGNPLRVIRNGPAYLGHAYRTVADAKLVVPNGHAGCSLNNSCSETITVTAISRPLAP